MVLTLCPCYAHAMRPLCARYAHAMPLLCTVFALYTHHLVLCDQWCATLTKVSMATDQIEQEVVHFSDTRSALQIYNDNEFEEKVS